MNTDQILSAIILIAVLSLVMPTFLNTNSRLKQFLRNLPLKNDSYILDVATDTGDIEF